MSHEKSKNYWRLKDLGAGLWTYDPGSKSKCIFKSNPRIQKPSPRNRLSVSRRFRTLRDSKFVMEQYEKYIQLQLCDFSTKISNSLKSNLPFEDNGPEGI